MTEGDITPDKLKTTINGLVNDKAKLENMKQCALKMSTADATSLIYEEIKKLTER